MVVTLANVSVADVRDNRAVNGPFRAEGHDGAYFPRPFGLGWHNRPFRPVECIAVLAHLDDLGTTVTLLANTGLTIPPHLFAWMVHRAK
jgi:hypothetical protein